MPSILTRKARSSARFLRVSMLAIDCDARFLERVVQGTRAIMMLHDFFELFTCSFLHFSCLRGRTQPPVGGPLLSRNQNDSNTFVGTSTCVLERVNDQTPTFSEQTSPMRSARTRVHCGLRGGPQTSSSLRSSRTKSSSRLSRPACDDGGWRPREL